MKEVVVRLSSPFSRYGVTEKGKVYSFISNKWMKTKLTRCGYEQVKLMLDSKSPRYPTVHILVANAFMERPFYPDDGIQINHIDGIKTNNTLSNLEISNASLNQLHALNNKLSKSRKCIQGYKPSTGFGLVFKSTVDAAKGVVGSTSQISRCANKRAGYLTHKNYYWSYL